MDQNFDLTAMNISYSTKNIPIPTKKEYLKNLIIKTEKFIKNLRWRTFFVLNPDTEIVEKETYGFNSTKPPPILKELKDFEDGLTHIIQNIKFRKNKQFPKPTEQ